MRNILFIMLALTPCLLEGGCRRDRTSDEVMKEVVAARILRPTCAGTSMQLIDASFGGETWRCYVYKDGEFDRLSPMETYENCVLVVNVPLERNVVGDTLLFTYTKGSIPGNYCDLGGLPNQTISLETLRN